MPTKEKVIVLLLILRCKEKLVDEAKKELLCKLSQLEYKKEEIAMLIRHFLEDY